jgi:glyoxylase-like metal-dependent hydrolase (beta-lactamase superfamily II)
MSVTRREFLYLSSTALAAIPRRATLFSQTPPPPRTSFESIRRNVGIFNGSGGTIGWLSNKDALIVVDSQFPNTAKICLDGLKQKAGRNVDLLFNTHHHGDHTGGNGVFNPEVKKIIAHSRVPPLLQQQHAAAQTPPGGTPPPPPVPPDATFDKAWTERPGDEEVNAKHYGPAHTGGDAIIHFRKANVVHMGDLLFRERHPFIDRPAGASIQNWITALETIAKEFSRDTIYIAGHAKQGLPVLTDRAALLTFRDYFNAVLTHTQRAIKEGTSKEEIVKLEVLPGFEGYQGSGARLSLAGSLGVAYDELTNR